MHALRPVPSLCCPRAIPKPSISLGLPLRTHLPPCFAAGSAGVPQSSDGPITSTSPGFVPPELGSVESNGVHSNGTQPKKSMLQKIKEYFLGSKEEKNKLASLGIGAFASYSVISNVTYGACLCIAWITFVKATGNTPMMEGQWKPFLAFYAGLWTFQNFVRPARFALAVALAPQFEKLITGMANMLRVPKPVAFTVFLAMMATVMCTSMFLSLWAFGGFPYGLPFFTKAA